MLEGIERSRNLSLEDMKGLLGISLEAVVGSVESMMSGISDEMASDRKKREGEGRVGSGIGAKGRKGEKEEGFGGEKIGGENA